MNQSRLEELRRRWEAEPGSRVFLQLADEYRQHGRNAEAADVLERGLERRPNDLSGMVALGRCRLDLGALDKAIEILDEVVSRDPTHVVALKLLIEAHLQGNDRARASERLETYRLVNDRDPEFGHLEYRLSQLEDPSDGTKIDTSKLLDDEDLAIEADETPTAEIPTDDVPSKGVLATDDSIADSVVVEPAASPPEVIRVVAAADAARQPQRDFVVPHGLGPKRSNPSLKDPFPWSPAPLGAHRQRLAEGGIFWLPAPTVADRDDIAEPEGDTALLETVKLEEASAKVAEPLRDESEAAEETPDDGLLTAALTGAAAAGAAVVAGTAFDAEAEDEASSVDASLAEERDDTASASSAEHEEDVPAEEPEPSAVAEGGAEPATVTLGELYLAQGHHDEARRIFRDVLERDSGNAAALAGLREVEQGASNGQPLSGGVLTAAKLLEESVGTLAEGMTARKVQMLRSYAKRLRGVV